MNINRLTLLLTALLLIALSARPDAEWLTHTHDFGPIDETAGTATCTFRLVNHGPDTISIFAARANCGCTTPTYTTDPILPGDTATLTVGFDPSGRPGRFVKHINVDATAEPRRTSLTIQGTVVGAAATLRTRYPIPLGPARLRAASIPYGKIYKGHAASQYLEAINASHDTIHPRILRAPAYLNIRIQPAAVPPGEQFIISTTLHTTDLPQWGAFTDSLLLATTPADSTRIDIVAIMAEDFSTLTPQQLEQAPHLSTPITAIDLERIAPTSRPVTRDIPLKNTGRTPLIIRAVTCADPAVSLRLKDHTIPPGKTARLRVTVDPTHLPPDATLLNTRILLIANDPDNPTTPIRIVGEIIR